MMNKKNIWIGIIIIQLSIWIGSWALDGFAKAGDFPVFPTLPILAAMITGIVYGVCVIIEAAEDTPPRRW